MSNIGGHIIISENELTIDGIQYYLKKEFSWGGTNNYDNIWSEKWFITEENQKIFFENGVIGINCDKHNFVVFDKLIEDNTIIEFEIKTTETNGNGFCLARNKIISSNNPDREFELCSYASGETKYYNWKPNINKTIYNSFYDKNWFKVKISVFNGKISVYFKDENYENIGTCSYNFYLAFRGWCGGTIYIRNIIIKNYIFGFKELDELKYVLNYELGDMEGTLIDNSIQKIYLVYQKLKNNLKISENIIHNFPQLSRTAIGKSTSDGQVIYRNWWSAPPGSEFKGFTDHIWFSEYLKYLFPNEKYKLNFFSIYGEHLNVKKEFDGKKIFFSGETLNKRFKFFNQDYGSYALNYMDFAMGYDLINHPHYLRFPFWIIRHFRPPLLSEEDIINKIENWNSLDYPKTKSVVSVSSHDWGNTRGLIADDISSLVDISYGGKWRNNSSDLINKFNDNKCDYLKQFKFNICAENLDDRGYVTEKIFDAIDANCIPLYIGGGDYLEPKVLNPKAILLWKVDEDNSDTIELFKNLLTDEKTYNEFKDQNILLDSSSKFIINKFKELKRHFERLIYDTEE